MTSWIMNNVSSSTTKKCVFFYIINAGNTQESILGPKLLSLDRNDPPESHQRTRLITYADDTCVYTCATSATGVSHHWTGVWHHCTWRRRLSGLNIQVRRFMLNNKMCLFVSLQEDRPHQPSQMLRWTNSSIYRAGFWGQIPRLSAGSWLGFWQTCSKNKK